MQTTNLIYLIYFLADQMTLLITCYYWLQHSYICLPLREEISCDICFIFFYRSQALRFRFYRFQNNVFLNLYFLKWLLWLFKRERISSSPEEVLTIVNRWIPFDSLKHIQESWRWPDFLERKDLFTGCGELEYSERCHNHRFRDLLHYENLMISPNQIDSGE